MNYGIGGNADKYVYTYKCVLIFSIHKYWNLVNKRDLIKKLLEIRKCLKKKIEM